MIYVNVILTTRDEADVPEIAGLFRELRRLSLQEPGCERYEVYHSNHDKRVFLLIERWIDQAALEQHRLGHGYLTIYAPLIIPRVDRVPHFAELIE